MLEVWTHNRSPVGNDVFGIPNARDVADFRIEGKDAERAGLEYKRQANPRYLFDLPAGDWVVEYFPGFAKSIGMDARAVRLKKRVPHRTRVDLALEQGGGAGEVQYHGACAVASEGVPVDRSLPVIGERIVSGKYKGRLRSVALVCDPTANVATSERIGMAGAEAHRLMIADVDALGEWVHDDKSLDGLADVAFWGEDDIKAARVLGARRLDLHTHGWRDLPLSEAESLRRRIGGEIRKYRWNLSIDFRRHSHHHQVMEQVRHSKMQAGVVDVGDATMCVFMTSWGNGTFPVFRDRDGEGRLVAIRIDLGNEEVIENRQQEKKKYSGKYGKFALIDKRGISHGVHFASREAPLDKQDSGWIFLSSAKVKDPKKMQLILLGDVVARDDSIEEILGARAGISFARDRLLDTFARVRLDE